MPQVSRPQPPEFPRTHGTHSRAQSAGPAAQRKDIFSDPESQPTRTHLMIPRANLQRCTYWPYRGFRANYTMF
jgi:hypothetical protein